MESSHYLSPGGHLFEFFQEVDSVLGTIWSGNGMKGNRACIQHVLYFVYYYHQYMNCSLTPYNPLRYIASVSSTLNNKDTRHINLHLKDLKSNRIIDNVVANIFIDDFQTLLRYIQRL